MEVSRFPSFLSSAFSALVFFLDARIQSLTVRIFRGMFLAQDQRRTASRWFRAAGIRRKYKSAYRHLAAVGRESLSMSTAVGRLVLKHPAAQSEKIVIALDDTLTKRYGPKVEGAGIHHNPTPGPIGQLLEYGQNFVVAALLAWHPLHGIIGLPLRAQLYVRQKEVATLPRKYQWKFRTKLQLAVEILQWLSKSLFSPGKAVWIVADGGYAKKPILRACRQLNFTLISRLRKDAALYELPSPSQGRGRPRKYGEKRIDLAKRAAHARGWSSASLQLYGRPEVKTYKSFLATWKSAEGVIRVVLVKEKKGWIAFFSTNPEATVAQILETVASRNAIEQVFKDVKEVWRAGQQQLRNLHANIGAFHMNLWMMTLTELWAWNQPQRKLVDRADRPWDNQPRRPSHNDRRKSLLKLILQEEFRALPQNGPGTRKYKKAVKRLFQIACSA